jgi:hypothetical protein
MWQYVIAVPVIALIFYAVSNAIIGSYFKAKRNFVNELVDRLKGAGNGKRK